MTNLPYRVDVWAGDEQTCLGQGTYVENVTVYAVRSNANSPRRGDSHIVTFPNPQVRPTEEQIASVEDPEILELHDNPKIVLDDGTVVYGCQVWWKRAPDLRELNALFVEVAAKMYMTWQVVAPPASGVPTFRGYVAAVCDILEGKSTIEEVQDAYFGGKPT